MSPRSHQRNMSTSKPNPAMTARELVGAWGRVLCGNLPMLSIEITRECPLSCPGCYAYGESHLAGGVQLRDLADFRGDALINGVFELVHKHRPMHVSLVGGEPLIRHRELSAILPGLSEENIFTLVVTSGVIPIPIEWMKLPRVRVAVSVDGLPEHHDIRRKPATYDRILKNIRERDVNIHWVITGPMFARASYFEEYVSFWNARPEVNRIWVSFYTPQKDEQSAEMLVAADRKVAAAKLTALAKPYPKLLFHAGIAQAFLRPPENPDDCLFAKMSANYSADLRTRVEPCVFGGTPDCSQCGCMASTGLHWIRGVKVVGRLKVGDCVGASVRIGSLMNRLRRKSDHPSRWSPRGPQIATPGDLVHIKT